MEPQLISRKAIKKILKKNSFIKNYFLNKLFNSFINIIKLNWLPIIIIFIATALLIMLFIENKNKKEALKNEVKELEKIQKTDKFKDHDDFKQKSNYESEYYKMLPRVTTSPEVVDYMYQS
jgi:hypothetical protein